MAKDEMSRYSFQLLRYVPNLVSDEHFNIGVLLSNDAGQILVSLHACVDLPAGVQPTLG